MSKKQDFRNLQSIYTNAQLLHSRGELSRAIELYTRALKSYPDSAALHYNLGLAHYESGAYEKSVAAYRQAALFNPADYEIQYNLGLACKMAGNYDEAEAAYLNALDLSEDKRDILYNLGCCYIDADAPDKALIVFESLLEIDPDHVSALNNLAYLHHLQENFARAKELYARVLELDPDRDSARHMHATLTGEVAAAPPPAYIRELFDRYSEYFEENLLQDLQCDIYRHLRQLFDRFQGRKEKYAHCLDLGCGTGLAGQVFRSACHRLSGVDLSAKMIEQAEGKGLYDDLHVADIITFLRKADDRYDLILGADILPYLGDLDALFSAVTKKAGPEALFCFSSERAGSGEWELQLTGRYAHNPRYIQKLADNHGWMILHSQSADIRREHDSWIKGTIFLLGRKKTEDI